MALDEVISISQRLQQKKTNEFPCYFSTDVFNRFFRLFIFILANLHGQLGMCMITTCGARGQRKDEQHTNTRRNQSVHSYTRTRTHMFYDKFIAHFLFILWLWLILSFKILTFWQLSQQFFPRFLL